MECEDIRKLCGKYTSLKVISVIFEKRQLFFRCKQNSKEKYDRLAPLLAANYRSGYIYVYFKDLYGNTKEEFFSAVL